MKYVMESGDETRRLLVQEQADFSREALRLTGLTTGARVLDAGCGPGGITAFLAEWVGPSGQVTGMDLSPERLANARQLNQHHAHVQFHSADIRRTGLPDAAFDFTWSQFVLQYLPDRWDALAELVRVTRPGGKVVISEFDGFGMDFWPAPEPLRDWCLRFTQAIERTVGLDIHVGRKVFHAMRRLGLRDVRVHLLPQYVIAGAADSAMSLDWETRFSALESALAPVLGGVEDYRLMSRKYLELLADSDALKYSILLVTEGTRP
ncbi:methyltransferase domain-containing protein [Melittangium boletus]|uniref:methyltransferase domain-containing protein n=1 Tax=Melittangium boletus TaxID=83453 RepID=UPI003DA26452